jgi:hypothetical protein
MGIPVGLEYKAAAVDLVETRDECGVCGAERKASVLTTAYGTGTAPFLLFAAQARQEAAENAELAIPRTAGVLTRLARCPSCGGRHPDTESSRRTSHVFRYLVRLLPVAAAVLTLEALVLGVALSWKVPVAVLVAVALACWAAAVVLATRSRLRRDREIADRSVEWTHVRERGAPKWKRLGARPRQSG